MQSLILEISIVFILLVANGLCAMTEIAIVSSRKGLLRTMADGGNSGSKKALVLSESPNRFLSTVQIGITLVGIIAGAMGSGNIANSLAEVIAPLPFIGDYARPLALGVVISILTYFSLVVGELVPKRLAMKFPEAIASAMAGPMAALSTIAAPAVSLLSWSTGRLLRLFGIREDQDALLVVHEGGGFREVGRSGPAFDDKAGSRTLALPHDAARPARDLRHKIGAEALDDLVERPRHGRQ